MLMAFTKVGTVFVDQFAATLQSPLTGLFQLTAVMPSLSLSPQTVSDLDVENRGLIDQKGTEKDGA